MENKEDEKTPQEQEEEDEQEKILQLAYEAMVNSMKIYHCLCKKYRDEDIVGALEQEIECMQEGGYG